MKWIADENIPRAVLRGLRDLGENVVGVVETAAGSDNRSVFAWARRQGRILLTFDEDFAELFAMTPLSETQRPRPFAVGHVVPWGCSEFHCGMSRDDWGNASA
jgi:uncharacterized protein DUF5615